LDKKYGIPPQLIIQLEVKGCVDSEACDGDFKGGGTVVLPWKSRKDIESNREEALTEAEKTIEEERRAKAIGGLQGGYGELKITPPTVNDLKFYLETVSKYAETISRLESILRSLAGKRWFVPATDGEFNTSPQIMQEAYTDSFKGLGEDERPHYLTLQTVLPEVDLCLICDQSGSTYGSDRLFAEASVCIIEAARRVKKIRTAAVGLGDGIRILKAFEELLEAGRFAPTAGGGTPLGAAIEEATKLHWRGGQAVRLMIILTDGYPDSFEHLDRALQKVREMKIAVIGMCVGIAANEEYRSRFDEVYEVNDPSSLASALFKAFCDNAVFKVRQAQFSRVGAC
jgi:hypothetical protein